MTNIINISVIKAQHNLSQWRLKMIQKGKKFKKQTLQLINMYKLSQKIQRFILSLEQNILYRNNKMNPLKYALGSDEKQQKSISRSAYSIKNYNKSKSQSIWALDPDVTSGDNNQPKQNNKFSSENSKSQECQDLQVLLNTSFQKQKVFSQIIFYEIIETIQAKTDISQLDLLLEIQKKMKNILSQSSQQTKDFNVSFYQLLIKRIKKHKRKQKKEDLKQYERIIHTNFKKKAPVQYINEQHNTRQQYLQSKDNQMNRGKALNLLGVDGSSSKKSNSSNQGKLKGLLSPQKLSNREQADKKQNVNQSLLQANQSVSFSAVISQSMAVRQRAPRVLPKKEKLKQEKQRNIHDANDNQQSEKDQAFIFFRPKKAKKTGKY